MYNCTYLLENMTRHGASGVVGNVVNVEQNFQIILMNIDPLFVVSSYFSNICFPIAEISILK